MFTDELKNFLSYLIYTFNIELGLKCIKKCSFLFMNRIVSCLSTKKRYELKINEQL